MPKTPPSPRSQQRLRLFDTYRGRGHRTNPLWLVYSVKTGKDLILPSDCHLIHWLMFLESYADVVSFEHAGDGNAQAGHPISVRYRNGTAELHYVQSAAACVDHAAFDVAPYSTRAFDEKNLRSLVPVAMRWLKAIAFASALRDKNLTAVRIALVQLLANSAEGTVDELISEMHGFDRPVVVGLLVQFAIEGIISLDLTASGLHGATRWMILEVSDVVA